MYRILLTSTSFQDSPGKHQALLYSTGFIVDKIRGPVKENILLPIISNYDGIICGDDEITENVIKAGKRGKIKVISKYGVGLDKIDLVAANSYNVPVTNCQGVNHITVAEHVMGLLLTFVKNIHIEYNFTKTGEWRRLVGTELYGKKFGIIGLGKIGKEVAIRAKAFGMDVRFYDLNIDYEFAVKNELQAIDSLEKLISSVDIISISIPLTTSTIALINEQVFSVMHDNVIIINTSRALVVEQEALLHALENRKIAAYLTDVLEEEPMRKDHPFLKFDNVIITPHIGSRTKESVERQGIMAVENLLNHLKDRK